MSMPFRRIMIAPALKSCAIAIGIGIGVTARAQSNWEQVAVPVYTPVHMMQGLHRQWTAPQSDSLAREAGSLTMAMEGYCKAPGTGSGASLDLARRHWRASATAWERLSAVAVGPLVSRRSARQIDFTPTRPALIERAIKAMPAGADAMERIGTPAKGFPALEWLLWTRPVTPDTPACSYAVEVARDVEREAQALRAAFKALAEQPAAQWDDEMAVSGMNEFVNQWAGGIERLRWAQMEKPLRANMLQELPRAASGTTAASWAAHWQGLRALTKFAADAVPVPGKGLVPIETYLRGRAANTLADQLVRLVDATDGAMKEAVPSSSSQLPAAANALAALKRLAELEVAPALNVNIGFSNADGD